MLEWCSMAVMTISSPALDVLAAKGLRDQVDAFGRAAHEDDLAARRAALRKRCTLRARRFVGVGGALAESSCTPRWMLALSCS